MPIEILELIVRARVQQNGPDTASTTTDTQSGGSNNTGVTETTQHTAQGAQQPTVEEVVSQLLKRRSER